MSTHHHEPRDGHPAEPEPMWISGSDEIGLTPLGRQILEALRDDARFRDVVRDPFGDDGPAGDGPRGAG
ncbi:MAG TPA: hypothetical protein VFT50_15160 [Baekduia sp.]|nr:hypothetical protein [Baekduia sp.]